MKLNTVFVLAIVVASCGTPAPVGEGDELLQAEVLRMQHQELSDYQAQLAADGVVTRSEYEQAALAAADCLGGSGVAVAVDLDARVIRFSEATMEAPGYASCRADYLDGVEALYQFQNVQSEAEMLEESRLFDECIRSLGYDVPDLPDGEPTKDASFEDVPEQAMLDCWEAVLGA